MWPGGQASLVGWLSLVSEKSSSLKRRKEGLRVASGQVWASWFIVILLWGVTCALNIGGTCAIDAKKGFGRRRTRLVSCFQEVSKKKFEKMDFWFQVCAHLIEKVVFEWLLYPTTALYSRRPMLEVLQYASARSRLQGLHCGSPVLGQRKQSSGIREFGEKVQNVAKLCKNLKKKCNKSATYVPLVIVQYE